MEVDYTTYAEGEALLGWLNCTVQLTASRVVNGDKFLRELAGELQRRLQAEKAEVAHLKMTLSPDPGIGRIGVINLVRNDFVPELSMELGEPMMGGQLIINLRAEAAPDVLGTSGPRGAGGCGGEVRDVEGDAGSPGALPAREADADAPV